MYCNCEIMGWMIYVWIDFFSINVFNLYGFVKKEWVLYEMEYNGKWILYYGIVFFVDKFEIS